MSELPGVSATIELLRDLRDKINVLTAREQALTRSRESISLTQTRSLEAAVLAENERFAAVLAESEAALAAARENFEAWNTRRQARISKAHVNARKQVHDRIERLKGREIYAVQQGTLAAGRTREQSLAANEARQQEQAGNLENARVALAAVERKARAAFRGYWTFRRLLGAIAAQPAAGDGNELMAEFSALFHQSEADIAKFQRRPAPAFFRFVPPWLFVVFLAAALILAIQFSFAALPPAVLAGAAVFVLVLAAVFHQWGKRESASDARGIADSVVRLRVLYEACRLAAAEDYRTEIERIETEEREEVARLNAQWIRATCEAGDRGALLLTLDEKAASLAARHEMIATQRLTRLEEHYAGAAARLTRDHEEQNRFLEESSEEKTAKLTSDNASRWGELEAEWAAGVPPIFSAVQSAIANAAARFPDWKSELWDAWSPPQDFGEGVPFANLEVDLARFCNALPRDPRLTLTGPAQFALPLLLTFPQDASLLFETPHGGEAVAGALSGIVLRLLSQSPPGRLNVTLIDPVGLGQNFAGLMHLADYENSLINNRIWTQSSEIEQRLADLNKHMEKVIQLYLRNEHATIREYNERAGNIAEKYHYLVIADFPVNFTEAALRHLVNIAVNGARCGVYTLIHLDRRQESPPAFVLDELRKHSIGVSGSKAGFELSAFSAKGLTLQLDPPPAPELATRFLHRVGAGWKDSNRVEVPFVKITPPLEEIWSLDTAEELRVPIGRAGATKLQFLAIGRGTRQHTLIGGKTGSGKSTLFHIIITNLALWCSPEQVEFYLVDFKKGVEFKCYATHKLPHARVIAIESDREFGLGVLQRLDEELRRRGDLFRKLGVQDLGAYRKAGGTESMPRSLLMVDEFQEFFVEDDRISQESNMLLDRIVRQGRAFGIHVILGSQTLGGAYTLARATMGQMVIRIALQCNEADAQLIMDDNNPAPRLLTRPGEGIYNDMAGAMEGNSPFQTVWLSEEEREKCLRQIHDRAKPAALERAEPFVYEGNAPAEVRGNVLLQALLSRNPEEPPARARLWLGEPNAIKGPTEAVFQRQSGHHLLLVGQSDEAVLAAFSVGLISLAAQYPRNGVRFVVFDSTPPGTSQHDFLQRLTGIIPQEIVVARGPELTETLRGLTVELKRRSKDPGQRDGADCFVFFHGLQNFKKLRQEDDFSFSSGEDEATPAKMLGELLTDGAANGIHVIAACDSYNNVMRFVGRKALTEFELRILFQMSANDSASLVDSPKAGTLGLHRALLYNAQEGYLEVFRPYALPDPAWIEEAGGLLRQRIA
ncbi:MAG: FtsK/SpoIIIE domain-containing protein [Terrimicrobiaceae bacterium]